MVRSDWAADQFARGSLTFVYVGSTDQHRTTLATAVGDRLFFAGEATDLTAPGTIDGAMASGERAAAEVARVALPGEKVTIVGAGAAGAAAARMLGVYGFEVTVIDARDRVGGRIHTAISNSWPVPVEFGALLLEPGAAAAAQLEALQVDVQPPGAAETRDASGAVVGAVASDFYGIDPSVDSVVTGSLVDLVTDALGDTSVFLSTTVAGVHYDDDSVSLRLGSGESLTADRVVMTVPLGVLKSNAIEFAPALPNDHLAAIEALGVAVIDTVWLRFDEKFWTTDATAWRLDGTSDDLTTWLNLEPLTGEPILVALVSGDAAARVAALDDNAVVAAAMAALTPFAAH